MKRYDFADKGSGEIYEGPMYENENGNYVLYSDHLTEINDLERIFDILELCIKHARRAMGKEE